VYGRVYPALLVIGKDDMEEYIRDYYAALQNLSQNVVLILAMDDSDYN